MNHKRSNQCDRALSAIHCSRWMSTAIPDFHKQIQLLDNTLHRAFSKAGIRTKSALKIVPLHIPSWGTQHKNAIASIQNRLRSAVKMVLPKLDKVGCVYTDASEMLQAAILTETEGEQLEKPAVKQRHKPFVFLRCRFNGAQRNWIAYEKEPSAVVQTFYRLNYVFGG